MADARPTFPLPQRYTQRKTEAVQPPDDRTYSAEVTSFPSNLLHHRSARAECPYTRSIILTRTAAFVNYFFRKFHKNFYVFLVFSEKKQLPFFMYAKQKTDGRCRPFVYALYLGSQVRLTPKRLKVFSSTPDRITLE